VLLSAVVSVALAAPPVLNLAPFGIGVYAHGRPLRGVVYSLTQAGGITAATLGTIYANEGAANADQPAIDKWSAVSAVGVATALTSYAVSLFDGSRLHDLEQKDAEETARAVRAWDAAVVAAREER
jgi:hypothetical protein